MTAGPPLLAERNDRILAGLLLVLGSMSLAFFAHTLLEEEVLAVSYISQPLWQALVLNLGGQVTIRSESFLIASVPSLPVYLAVAGLTAVGWVAGTWQLTRAGVAPLPDALALWARKGWRWWLLAAAWCVGWVTSLMAGWSGLTLFLARSSPLWVALLFNLWVAEWFALRRRAPGFGAGPPVDPTLSARQHRRLVWISVGLYTLVFTAMNWGLWFNLQVPHGDSAMYEEHLWNVWHGKGFRSYLDQGLFLGEHIQVIHLLLLPLHVPWPSQLMMELADSAILALTALPVYSLALRHCGSPRAAAWLAIATLLYFPLQYLDISIDFKTFRPSAFGIPALLAAIDQIERRRWRSMTGLLLLTLSAEEVFAIPVSLVGLWLALTGGAPGSEAERRRSRWIGGMVCGLAGLYLLLAVKFVIPWFREGATVHYARYFTRFGETPTEILRNMLLQPRLVLGEALDAPTFLYAAYLLAPLGFVPLLSPGRLATGLPLFALLCLNELSQDPPGPFHHFHAPLLPLILWAAAAGLRQLSPTNVSAEASAAPVCSGARWNTAVCGARFALGCSLLTGAWFTLSPLGTRFWDSGRIVASRPTYWRALYLPDDRARAWEVVAPLIPDTARVASTDFVHARLTHCERSYDYSRYARRVAGYEDRVPADTNYIVIDLQHPYSRSVLGEVARASEVRELRESPEDWELLTDADDGYFVVLRRKAPPPRAD